MSKLDYIYIYMAPDKIGNHTLYFLFLKENVVSTQ